MWNWLLGSIAVIVVVAGCGNGNPPPISYPADGQKIVLDQPPYGFDVTLADNDYQDVVIEIRGSEVFQGELICSNGVNAPARCTARPNTYGYGGGFNQVCVEGRPCILVIIARRGTAADVRTVQVVRYSQQGVQQPQQ